ncbi:hypothetical protein A0K93_01785 [Corynebacterium sp. BCW_4722]|nr:hypothetical protein A0K93_01785 [Corynebacterium sp. BCW_4722]
MDTTFYHVSERTVERVAEVAASSVPGCEDIDAKLAGLAGRSFPRIDVRLDQLTGTANIEAEIACAYPAPIAAITDAVRATIIAHVRALTGVDVARVKVTVANVEALASGRRVTWDEVAHHEAFVIPVPIEVTPTQVVHPQTKEREELTPVKVSSNIDEMRDVVTPAPPEVEHIEAPTPVLVASVATPEPVEVETEIFAPPPPAAYSPEVPAPRPLTEVHTYPTEARVPFPPAPATPWSPTYRIAAVHSPYVPPQGPLTPVEVRNPVRAEQVSLPLRPPMREVSINRPPQRPVEVRSEWRPAHIAPPPPTPVYVPSAPAPQPLKEIRIEPVVKYYDRTR